MHASLSFIVAGLINKYMKSTHKKKIEQNTKHIKIPIEWKILHTKRTFECFVVDNFSYSSFWAF